MNEQAPQWLSYFWKQTERHSYEPYKERAINGANRQMLGRVLIRGSRNNDIGGNGKYDRWSTRLEVPISAPIL